MDGREPLRRIRASLERGPRDLRARWWPLTQIALAAGLAWLLSDLVPGHSAGIFAPIIAAVALGAGPGQRGSMAVQFIVGVALGILVGDLVAWLFGGGTWQLALAAACGLAFATLIGLSDFVALQTGISALIVVGLHPAQTQLLPDRLVDALVGGAVALAFSQVLFPADPEELLAEAAEPALGELEEALRGVAEALREGDEDRARDALRRSEGIDDGRLRDALAAARAIATRAPRRRGRRSRIDAYGRVADQLASAGRDASVLALGAARLIRADGDRPAGLGDAIDLLADAVEGVRESLRRADGAIRPGRSALVAARRTHVALRGDEGVAAGLVRNQVESLVRDLLRSCGAGDEAAADAVRRAREGADRDEASVFAR